MIVKILAHLLRPPARAGAESTVILPPELGDEGWGATMRPLYAFWGVRAVFFFVMIIGTEFI